MMAPKALKLAQFLGQGVMRDGYLSQLDEGPHHGHAHLGSPLAVEDVGGHDGAVFSVGDGEAAPVSSGG